MDLQLTAKRAIVTGGSRGIGLAIAQALAAEGADLAIAARHPAALEVARQALGAHGGRVLAVATDTTDDTSVQAMVAQVVTELGGVDILVNAAAEPNGQRETRTDLAGLLDDDLRKEIETKVLGYLRTARAAAPHMQAAGWGRIINISGLAARQVGSPFGSIRNVAVHSLTKNLADQLGASGVNVVTVHPGMTVTEATPGVITYRAERAGVSEEAIRARMDAQNVIGRLVTAAEVADVVAFLASPRSVAVTGDAIAVGGGVPGPIYL